MKYIFIILTVSSLCAVSFANGEGRERRGPPRMNLTDEQRTCLESKIGKPGEGERPSREVMESAFEACGVEKPKGPPGGKKHRRPGNTEEEVPVEQ